MKEKQKDPKSIKKDALDEVSGAGELTRGPRDPFGGPSPYKDPKKKPWEKPPQK